MPRPKAGERVKGPYRHHSGFRVIHYHPDNPRVVGGRVSRETFFDLATEAEALDVVRSLQRKIHSLAHTIGWAIGKFLDHKRADGKEDKTVEAYEYLLRLIFPDPGVPLADYEKIDVCRRAYEDLRARKAKTPSGRYSVDTHKNALIAGGVLLRWCCEDPQEYIKVNGFHVSDTKRVKGIGKRHKGKEQLNIPEARKLMITCMKRAAAGDQAAVAVMATFMNLRGGEVTDREPRDIEAYDDVMYFVIDRSKTKHGERDRLVPPFMRPFFQALKVGKPETGVCLWDPIRNGSGRATGKVIDAVTTAGRAVSAPEVAESTGVDVEVVRTLLYRLAKKGLVTRAEHGRYVASFTKGPAALERRDAAREPGWRPNPKWVLQSVKRLCAEAGVPLVTAHGMRGLWATMAVRKGLEDFHQQVLRDFGHAPGSTRTLEGHYAGKGAFVEAAQDNFWGGFGVPVMEVVAVGDEVQSQTPGEPLRKGPGKETP